MKPWLKIIISGLVMFVIATSINIPLHETGHFLAAKTMGFEPEFHFLENESENGFRTSAAVAYVSYLSPTSENTSKDAIIALSGPIVNLMLALIGLISFIKLKGKNIYLEVMAMVFFLISIVAFASNLIPTPLSDGGIILSALL